jgi:hypothetical protein
MFEEAARQQRRIARIKQNQERRTSRANIAVEVAGNDAEEIKESTIRIREAVEGKS